MSLFKPLDTFVAFDLETTGLDSAGDDILEIGAVKVEKGTLIGTFSQLLRSEKPLSYLVRSLTGLVEKDFESAMPQEEGIRSFFEFAGGLPLVAHNSDFDGAFLAEACRRVNHPPCENPVFDSLLLARIAWPMELNHRLENLVESLGIPPQKAHRALPDAEKAARLWLLAQERMLAFSPRTLAHIGHVLKDCVTPWRNLFPGSINESDFGLEASAEITGATSEIGIESVTPLSPPLEAEVDPFEKDGVSPEFLGGPEARQARKFAARIMLKGLREGGVTALDVEPGVGRTLAALVSAARFALSGGGRVLFCTHGGHLREETVRHFEILQSLYGPRLKLALLQEPQHYISRHKYHDILKDASLRLSDSEKTAFLPLITWMELTDTGSIQENAGFNHERHRVLWEKLGSDGYTQGVSEFAAAAKSRADGSHITVISHELFLRDLGQDFAFLAPLNRVIMDKADRLQDTASYRLGRQIHFFRLRNCLQVIAASKDDTRGLLAAAEAAAKLHDLASIQPNLERLRENLSQPEKRLQKFFNKIAKHGRRLRKEGESRLRYQGHLALEFNAAPDSVLEALKETSEDLTLTAEALRALPDSEITPHRLAQEFISVRGKLQRFMSDFAYLCEAGHDDEVFWMEDFLNPHKIVMRCAPISMASKWETDVYPMADSVLFLSSALDAGDQGRYFLRQMGATHDGEMPVRFQSVRIQERPRPRLLLAQYCPHPSRQADMHEVDAMLTRCLQLVGGRQVVYFTGGQSLRRCREELVDKLGKEAALFILAQQIDGGSANIAHLAKSAVRSLILATPNFTDGLPDMCETDLVVLTKLPFPVPGDPLTAARMDAIKEAGGNPALDFILPETVLKVKRMLSALKTRHGAPPDVWVLDPRLGQERYYRAFQKALPHLQVAANDEAELVEKTLAPQNLEIVAEKVAAPEIREQTTSPLVD